MGHVLHFEEAASLGDVLVVTITADKFITKKRSVSFTEEYRMRQVAALEIVDYVALVNEPSAVPALEALEPDVYVKGSEYANLVLDKTANIFREKTSSRATAAGSISRPAKRSPRPSCRTSCWRRRRRCRTTRCCATSGSCSAISRSSRFKLEEIKAFLVRASELRVCLLGETIVDEWVDISVTNLSQKSRCVAGQETARIRQIGATGIIALHLSGFVKQVDCFTNGSLGALPAECRGDAAQPESARQDTVRRSGQRVAALRVESARHSRRVAGASRFRRLRSRAGGRFRARPPRCQGHQPRRSRGRRRRSSRRWRR